MSETDTIPKTMLILKSQPGALGVVEVFLRNRGWQLHSTADLKEAMVQIVTQKPSYILISVDHSNKKTRALPKLLTSAFPVATIVFAESQSSVSYKILNESVTDYRVYPPVTGPAIERCVNKYLKDQQTKASIQKNENFKSGGKGAAGSEVVSIKGSSDFNSEGATRLLTQFLGEDAGMLTAIQVAAKGEYNNSIIAQPWTEEGEGLLENSSAQDLRATQQGQSPQQHGFSKGATAPEQKGSHWEPLSENEYSRRQAEGWARSEANETLIARGVQRSLEESVDARGGGPQAKIEETTSVACILVDSPRFSGYLIAAMGKNHKIDKVFMEGIKERLFKFLKENGEEVSKNDSLGINIKQVDFEPWALMYAEFLRKSVHQGNEVAIAFFPRRPIHTILEESSHHEMAKLPLEEFQGDRQVEFDLYVYLPSNNKYVLYTPKGGIFYNTQMDRLKKQGVTHMHIEKNAAEAVTKYKAQNYLNDMIEDHEQNQKTNHK
ncbi:MAG: hypothetical protein ACXWRE_06120 [Pseudobdellovibrionaceae bacterium]